MDDTFERIELMRLQLGTLEGFVLPSLLKTQIMYRANLSFAQLNEYLDFLTKIELLEIAKENRKTMYRTTDKGELYLEKYEDISGLLGKDENHN